MRTSHGGARTRTHGRNAKIPFVFSARLVHKPDVESDQYPAAQGLYDPRYEHDACGVGFVAHIKGHRSHDIVRKALQVLINLEHRGACGSEANTGDGAGILIQMPDRFLRRELAQDGVTLPPAGEYGAGLVFLPTADEARLAIQSLIEQIVVEEGQRVLAWRDVPTDHASLGASAIAVEPVFKQLIVARGTVHPAPGERVGDVLPFERKLFVIRKRIEHAVDG